MAGSHERSRNGRRVYVPLATKGLLFFLPLALLVFVARYFNLHEVMDSAWADRYLSGQGPWEILVYIAMNALLTLIGVPRLIPAFVGGYAFGPLMGTLYATLGNALSCACLFFYARFFAHKPLRQRFGERISRMDAFLSRNPFTSTIAIRTFPAGLNTLTSLMAGITSISAPAFIAGSSVGYIPQNLIFSLLGSGIKVDPFWRVFTAAVLFALSSLLGVLLFHKYRKEQKGL